MRVAAYVVVVIQPGTLHWSTRLCATEGSWMVTPRVAAPMVLGRRSSFSLRLVHPTLGSCCASKLLYDDGECQISPVTHQHVTTSMRTPQAVMLFPSPR